MKTFLRRIVLYIFALWSFFPLYWLLNTSLKTSKDALARPPTFIFKPILKNYIDVIKNNEVWGYFLDPKYDSTNTIVHEDLKDIKGFNRSGWSQRMRYLTEFGFIEGEWYKDFSGQLGFDMQLSESGLELKNNLRSYIEGENISPADLLSWPRENGLPEILISSYVKVLAEVSPVSRNITSFEKTIFCALNMCLNGNLFKQNRESRPTTEEEIDLVEQYFDVNSTGNSDYKWIGWIAENLVDLKLVEEIHEERFNRYYYQITDAGRNLIEEIVEKWQSEYSILFGEYINYETGVGLGQIEFLRSTILWVILKETDIVRYQDIYGRVK